MILAWNIAVGLYRRVMNNILCVKKLKGDISKPNSFPGVIGHEKFPIECSRDFKVWLD